MPATYDTLPLDARLVGVLEGWTGPVEVHWRSGMDRWAPSACFGGRVVTDTTGVLTTVLLTSIRLDLHRPESLHRIADWLAAGEREPCERCSRAWGQCSRCHDGGETDRPPWRRPPSPMWWALPREIGGTLPALWSRRVLGWSAESVVRGGKAIRGVLPAWTTAEDGAAYRLSSAYEWATRADAAGWAFSLEPDTLFSGPETGDEGRARADAAALAHSLALAVSGEDGPLTLPSLPETTT